MPEPDNATPVLPFPEMRLPAPAAEPPIWLFGESKTKTPKAALGRAAVPVAFVPIRLPCTRLPLVAGSVMKMPKEPFPEITLPAPTATPPTVLLRAWLVMRMPLCWFGNAPVPSMFVPM